MCNGSWLGAGSPPGTPRAQAPRRGVPWTGDGGPYEPLDVRAIGALGTASSTAGAGKGDTVTGVGTEGVGKAGEGGSGRGVAPCCGSTTSDPCVAGGVRWA